MTGATHPLTAVGATTALEVGLGHMLLNIGDPFVGRERDYTRWYEDDHFFASALMAPFVFAGRRWVAPRDLRALQYGRPGGDFDPPGGGAYAATYWIAPGHLTDYLAWSAGAGPQLDAQGRAFTDRKLVFVSFADRIGSVHRDARVPDDVFALTDPAGGLVVQLIDVPDAADRDTVADWLVDEGLPQHLSGAGAGAHRVVMFRGAADTTAMRPALREMQERADKQGRRLILLWFLDRSPRDVWESAFALFPALVASSGRAVVEWTAPFIPAHMGTDDYVDELHLE